MMKLVRSPDLPEASNYAAAEKRYSVVLRAELVAENRKSPVWVRVVNISAGGLMAVVPPGSELSGHVELAIEHLGRLAGQIAWARDGRVGIKFDKPVDPEQLMADRAERVKALAGMTGSFVKKSSSFFDEQEADDDVLPFVAMMQSKRLATASKTTA